MLNDILNLKGVETLDKSTQKEVNGGIGPLSRLCCDPTYDCCYTNPNYNGSNCRFLFTGTAGCV